MGNEQLIKSFASTNLIREAKKLTAFRLIGALVGGGLGYMAEKSPQAAALGVGGGVAAAYVIERLVVKVGQKLIYQFVDK